MGSFLIAAHAHPHLDIDEELARLDRLAEGCPEPTLDGLIRHLFRDEGFRGDTENYGHPRNSLLNSVIDRRIGIPITLAVVSLEVGRRLSIPLAGVGMPGHFLVRDRVDPNVFVDPFWRVQLDRDGCKKLFRAVHGAAARFEEDFLEPVDNRATLARILTNLRRSYAAVGDRTGALWAQCLKVLIPGITARDRRDLAALLAANGRFDAAAEELQAIADDGWGGDQDRVAARAMRSRLN
jgi:regulator of sirC expression with transglutaminase-like and TPR domain